MGLVKVILYASFVATSLAVQCPSCRNADCLGDVPLVECTRNIPPLPLGLHNKLDLNDIDVSFGCLELKYAADGKTERLNQCIIVNDKQKFCEEISSQLSVSVCNIRSPEDIQPAQVLTDQESENLEDVEDSTDPIPSSTVTDPSTVTGITGSSETEEPTTASTETSDTSESSTASGGTGGTTDTDEPDGASAIQATSMLVASLLVIICKFF